MKEKEVQQEKDGENTMITELSAEELDKVSSGAINDGQNMAAKDTLGHQISNLHINRPYKSEQ